ncbi:cysteine desulfurase [Mycoplasmoides genitalium]|uniref:Probable cysteine desulfurase n=2 Tax=Mycoplasmoides genitalium TaxID=2097 RepID=CSD_MYCGE|nr:aminotransferase class V-fold PLP-dependent enzyme [Mycoplasmoides genitalium]Q49420.1 RecName: Full=Probable cysteine desulfurase [Mycoplasmoides genitalium G37]ABY79306.1 aminotransferase, class V [synthetic Mycoplasma genitalium JCVI-1.0]AAC71561.1 aminotransferase, class V [Mycoplasmoides genitalium G37]AFQ03175.1 aminotransferase, class V [Mycoplasmoides genitalium M2321]AFQ03661.1 aminotransferase, class V [Mycoplasmoides genitalium M6282]AFQ04165.1 aminotransferase, class V [Mycopla
MSAIKFNPSSFRKNFKWFENNKNWINFDNAATSIALDVVAEASKEYYQYFCVNPHNKNPEINQKLIAIIEETRDLLAKFFNAKKNEIIFTSSATESLNLFAFGLSSLVKSNDEIILKEDEHAANVFPWVNLAKENKAKLKIIKKTPNKSWTDAFLKACTPSTKLLVITATSNLFGNSIDYEKISKHLKKISPNSFIVVDAVQAVPHHKIDITSANIDFLTFSTHKFYGPTGLGIAFIKSELQSRLKPFKLGGDIFKSLDNNFKIIFKEGPSKFEAGTLNIMAIYALNKQLKFMQKEFNFSEMVFYSKQLKNLAYQLLSQNPNIVLANHDQDVPIFAFKHKYINSADLATFLNIKKIIVRQGSICVGKFKNKESFLRVSLLHYNTKEELLYLEKLLKTSKNSIINELIY